MATISEVAKLAGVSVSTVSRIINHKPHVSPRKAALVADAMAKLGYTPLQAARQMRGSGSQTIAVTVPYITNPFFQNSLQRLNALPMSDPIRQSLCKHSVRKVTN